MSEKGLYKCFGRIRGEHAIFIPKEQYLAEKLVEKAHVLTVHEGVTLTIAKIRLEYWIPSLDR